MGGYGIGIATGFVLQPPKKKLNSMLHQYLAGRGSHYLLSGRYSRDRNKRQIQILFIKSGGGGIVLTLLDHEKNRQLDKILT
jgi:hypothetical protein